MSSVLSEPPANMAPTDRVLGRYETGRPGPTLVCVAGMHGNEPAGVEALRRVVDRLEVNRPPIAGRFLALVGNVAAMARGVRFIDFDLNRCWSDWVEDDAPATEEPGGGTAESIEKAELQAQIESCFLESKGDAFFIDLHTSSAPGVPFLIFGDTLRNRRFAFQFGVPKILGLEELVDGTVMEFAHHLGYVTMAFEGGQHTEPAAVERLEAVAWNALVATGCLDAADLPVARRGRETAANLPPVDANGCVPPVLEILYRCETRDGDGFRMNPGFKNFTPVEAGEILARDADGSIRTPISGLLLLPRYQGQGNDGFFVGRPVRPFWLKVSSVIRRAGLSSMAHWFPGVSRDPGDPHSLVVNRHVAHWLAPQVFHLLGYRKRRIVGDKLVVTRRHYDQRGPRPRPTAPPGR